MCVPVLLMAIGDVVGEGGLSLIERKLRSFQKLQGVDVTVANGENVSGVGISPDQARRLLDAGVDVVTLGNHVWRRREIGQYLDGEPRVLRPANLAPQAPGQGWVIHELSDGRRLLVVNLLGQLKMDILSSSPFLEIDRILRELAGRYELVAVDFHAEATSEKIAMAYHLDGRAAVLFGTHTHVPTADERVFAGGLGYITDLGMTGPVDSVLGVRPEQSVAYFRGEVPRRFEGAPGPYALSGALFDIDEQSGRCRAVQRISFS